MLAAWVILEGETDWTPAVMMPYSGWTPEVWVLVRSTGIWCPVWTRIEAWSWIGGAPRSGEA